MVSKFVKRRDFVSTFHNPDLHGFPTPESFLEQCKDVKGLRYLCFQWEKTPTSFDENGNPKDILDSDGRKSITHYQMYLEFLENTSYKTIQRELFKGRKVHFENRFGTQEEAINYCSNKGDYSDPKEAKELFIAGFFEWGTPKRSYSLVNVKNAEIPLNIDEQWIYLENAIIAGKYKNIDEVHVDFQYLVIHNESKIQRLINKYNPVNRLNVTPCRVIWIWGEKGVGKTTFTKHYIRSLGYKDVDVAKVSPQSSTANFRKKIVFNMDDERCKVLMITEVNSSFPQSNDLIAYIDRDERLDVKYSQIRNNFELIIINSIYKPEEVFAYLGKADAGQVLRRIYPNSFGSRVIHFIGDKEKLEEIRTGKVKFKQDIDFQDWYIPTAKYSYEEEDLNFPYPLPQLKSMSFAYRNDFK